MYNHIWFIWTRVQFTSLSSVQGLVQDCLTKKNKSVTMWEDNKSHICILKALSSEVFAVALAGESFTPQRRWHAAHLLLGWKLFLTGWKPWQVSFFSALHRSFLFWLPSQYLDVRNDKTNNLNIHGVSKKRWHSDFSLISVLEVGFYFFTWVLESEFRARFI